MRKKRFLLSTLSVPDSLPLDSKAQSLPFGALGPFAIPLHSSPAACAPAAEGKALGLHPFFPLENYPSPVVVPWMIPWKWLDGRVWDLLGKADNKSEKCWAPPADHWAMSRDGRVYQ